MVDAGNPDELEDWLHACRWIDYFKKGEAPQSRIMHSVSGYWPMATSEEKNDALAAERHHHVLVIDTSANLPYVTIDRLLTLALRAAGAARLPGKAPIGGLAYQLRNHEMEMPTRQRFGMQVRTR